MTVAEEMADINLRDVPPELKRDVNMAAAAANMTQKDWCLNVLSLEAKRALGHLEEEVRAASLRAIKAMEVGARVAMPACDVCGAACVEWGLSMRHCLKCGRNFER